MDNSIEIFNFKVWHLIVAMITFYVIIAYFSNQVIYNDNFFYSVFGNQFDSEQISKIIAARDKYTWLAYVSIPLVLFLKFLVIALLIYIGAFFLDRKINFNNCLKIVLLAELSSILAAMTTTVYFSIYSPRTLDEVRSFSPFALTRLINFGHLPAYLIYPFQLINPFEAAYWVILVVGVSYFIRDGLKKAFVLVASSYGVGLFIWVLIVMFIQVQFS